MKFIVIDPFGDEKVVFTKSPENQTLGALFNGHVQDIETVEVNGTFLTDWHTYELRKNDSIKLFIKVAVAGWIGILINILLSVLFSVISSLFAPKPKKPSKNKSQPSLGVAGIQNTIAPGTPKFITFGRRRVFGHLISSWVDLLETDEIGRPDSSRRMKFSAEYYMGVGQIAGMSEVKINNTHLCDIYGPPQATMRLGTVDQEIIENHELVHQVYGDGRDIEIKTREKKQKRPSPGRPITYTTKGGNVNKLTLFLQFPQGIWKYKTTGLKKNFFVFRIYRKRNTETGASWVDLGEFQTITTKKQQGFFWKIELEMPDADQWDIRINQEREKGNGSKESVPACVLFNVMETKYIRTTYPGIALLEIHGIANDQITGFDNMEASAIVDGRLVDVLENGIYTKQFTRNRVWIIRDIMFNREIGLGNRLSSTLWDDASGLRAARYYEESVPAYNGTEQRDYCDVILNEPSAGWDHIKNLLFEGRAALIPSGGKFKYTLNVDSSPTLLYSFPGNILDKTLQVETGSQEKPINTLRAEFPNIELDYKVVPAKIIAEDRGSDPERLESISVTSIVRKSQVSRLMNFRLKYLTQIKKRWTWKSPQTAIVSEPLDIAFLSYNVSKNLRGYNGFIKGQDHTSSQFVADRSVYLSTGITYSAHIRHQNTIEERFISNTVGGTYSIFNLTSPLSFTPDAGDIWVIGETDNHVQRVQIDDLEFDGEAFVLRAHEHIPTIYDDDLSDITELENASGTTPACPPLFDAQALGFGSAGITQGYLFNVVPSFSFLVGTYSDLTANTLKLSLDEPDTDDFFTGAYIKADLDSPRIITDYDGATRIATVSTDFLLAATQSKYYEINWPPFSPFHGFGVEGLSGATWFGIGTAEGTTLTILTGSTYSLFRFSPLNTAGVTNTVARPEVTSGRFDTTAPLPPLTLYLGTDAVRTGIATVELLLPLDRDIQYVETEFLSGLTQSDTFLGDLYDVSEHRNEKNTNTPLEVTMEVDLSSFDFGTTFSGRASTLDFFGNRSAWVTSFNSITLSASDTVEDQDDGDENVLETDGGTVGVTYGAAQILLYEEDIEGGTIGGDNALQLDLNLLVTPGSTTTTTLDFTYEYGGEVASVITAQIANGSTKIPDDSLYWLTFYLNPVNSLLQNTIAKKTGPEVPTNDTTTATSTITVDSSLDQIMRILLDINGDTTTEVTVINATLKQIGSTAVDEPYIVAGTIPGRPASSVTALVHPFTIPVSFETNLLSSFGKTRVAAGATLSFSLKKNEVEFGTMRFSPTSLFASFIATQTSFIPGDLLTITTPATVDATLSDVGWAILGTREE